MNLTISNFRHRRNLAKMLLIMKLTVLLLFTVSLQVWAENGYAQNVSITMYNVPLKKVFKEIQKQTGYNFLYSVELLEKARKVDISVQHATLPEVMQKCLQNTTLTYVIVDQTIVIRTKQEMRVQEQNATEQPPPVKVKGKVSDEKGQALKGVSVLIRGTSFGTSTNADGEFEIEVPDGVNKVLVFSFVGMQKQEIRLEGKTEINVSMFIVERQQDEVVIVGYGTVKKSDMTGSVATANSKDINRTPTGNLVTALQGLVTGAQVIQPSGAPGTAPIIRIRGANSLTASNNNPLYVIDGMILNSIGSDFNLDDAQSVQVLKDASATAIYGSRGANGVVIITTKRGVSGKSTVNYDSYVGVQKIIKKLSFLNSAQYKDYYLQARKNATTATQIDSSVINSNTNTDWQDEIYHNALIQNHSISVRGGTDKSRYYSSVNYFRQDGIIRNTDFSRFSLRFNGDHQINDKFQLSENLMLSYTNGNGILGDEVVANGIAWARPTQAILDGSGNPTVVSLPYSRTNPKSLVDNVTNQNIGYRFVVNVVMDYKIWKGLSAKVNVGSEVSMPVNNFYVPTNLPESGYRGSARKSFGSVVAWINENTLNYSTRIGRDHTINAVAGITFQDTKSDGLQAGSSGYIINGFTYNNLGAGAVQTAGSSTSKYSLLSYLGRVNYAYKDKWLLTLSGRYDGSSRLAEGHKYSFFPSGALAWKMSEEDFLKDSKTISELKIRGSWGKTGNQTVAPYSTFAQLAPTNVYLDGSATPSIGYVPQTVANQNLGWETTKQIDLGIDLGLFNNRIQVTADFYKKNTRDLLFSRITPPSSGYNSAIQNIGEVENKGVEIFIKSKNADSRTFDWTTTLNFSLNRSKVLDLGKTPDGNPVSQIYTGESLGWFPIVLGQAPYQPWGYTIDQIDKTTGTYAFKDINNDGVVDGKDQGIIGNFQPKFIIGFINDLNFHKFDLSVFLNGSVGNDVFVDAYRYSLALNGNNNILKDVYDGMGSKYPRPNADYGYSGGSGQNTTALIFKGTYLRFKAITLGYTIPFTKGLHNVRVYVTGANLITIDKNYPWYDPEVTAGPTANADVVTGWDRGGYANNKSVIIGLKVNF